jgi:DNA helicase IV
MRVSDHELAAEAAHHDRVRRALEAMQSSTRQLMADYAADFAESRRNRRPGDARPDHNLGVGMARHREERLDALAVADSPLFFGRVWLDSGEDYHLGRRHVRAQDDRSTPLVVDWRAPLAERFYRASVHRRLDVDRRRRFGFHDGALTGLEDEDLRSGAPRASALLEAEVTRPRTGPMRDIVATIAPEQDELIRRAGDVSLCVQGAPGTGKTAVGLHRAAWLLYTYPDQLRRAGMLVVGPHGGFLRYIADVLPMLGETAVSQQTVADLTGAAEAEGHDSPEVAAVKHAEAVLEVCERAVWCHLGRATEDLTVRFRGVAYTLRRERLLTALEQARVVARGWEAGRRAFQARVADVVLRQVEDRTGRPKEARWAAELRRDPAMKEFLASAWPRLRAPVVLRRLYRDEDFRDTVCAGLLEPDQADLLAQRGRVKPSAADVLLLDELQGHLGVPDSWRTYGHVVVDEAQDLSALECRAIARRCPSGSMTVLGDLAQGTTRWAASSWAYQMRHLGRAHAEVTELTDGFRVPQAVLDVANRLLPHLGVPVRPARSVRRDGAVTEREVEALTPGVLAAVEEALSEPGLVGVVAADDSAASLRSVLPHSDRLQVHAARLVKGLEFDHVVLVEPAEVVESQVSGEDRVVGLRHLYVAVTRAVSRLTVVRSRPGPPELSS